ncbi:MAG: cupin domain-containing protein [Candidatus Thermoplasmatota archaeon]|nr:cupin domain-containing protein [Candidatus Thermoplasmatota archaeon]MBU1941099.1 cupin domain-containing protein [Candidatus Thermoplasmatota archaeon]
MVELFSEPIKSLPKVDIALQGVEGYIFQGIDKQIVFLQFNQAVEIPKHTHDDQWEIVLNGCVDLFINGKSIRYVKGDHFFIPKDVVHAAKVFAGYAAIIFFNEKTRYIPKG